MSIADSRPPTRIGLHLNGMLLTPEEFDAISEWEEGYRYELVHGVLVVTPPPSVSERNPNDELGYLLRTYRDTHPQGFHLDDTVPEHTVSTSTARRRADRVIWAGLGRVPDYQHDLPSIAIEFVSSSSRDRARDDLEKREEYSEAGIQEYWIIDRFRRAMTIFRGTQSERVVKEGEAYTTDLLPGFELHLSGLLAVADRSAGTGPN